MPYIKRLVSLDDRSGKCGLPLPRSGSRRRRDDAVEIAAGDAFVRVCRLLACLAHHADGLFEDLLDECRRVVDRTKRLDDRLRDGLADRVAQLDVRTAGRPGRGLSANGDDLYSAPYQSQYGYDCQLLTTSSRPAAVDDVYAAVDHNPATLIADCDVYRSDGLPGGKIFSPCPTSTRWIDDVDQDSLIHNNQTVSSVRRSARRRSLTRTAGGEVCGRPSLSATDDDEVQSSSSTTQSTPESETTSAAVIAVDVTGATFTRQRTYLQSLKPTSQPPATELDYRGDDCSVQFASVLRIRPPSSRRSSAVSADYGFAVAAGVVRRGQSTRQQNAESAKTTNRRRATSETREYRQRQQEMTSSSSTTMAPSSAAEAGQQNRGRTTIRQLKRKNGRITATPLSAAPSSDNSRICSWRHSLCAGFKSSKCDTEDLWTASRPEATPSRLPSTTSSVTVTVVPSTPRTPTQSRSQSLPRSFRSSFIAPLRRLLSSRSLTSDADNVNSEERPSSSRRLVRGASDSGSSRLRPPSTATGADPTTSEKLSRRTRSLERRSSRQTQQRSFSRAALLNNRGAISSQSTKSAAVSSLSSSSSGARRDVYVELTDQPWTRPFASVRLRTHCSDDVDRYQSSSGHWSGDSGSACQRDSWNTAVSDDKTTHNDKDSAVCLLTNSDKQLLAETTFASDVSEKTDSDSTIVTVVTVESNRCLDDTQSLFSVDQDGFFTSMHADSGLAVQRMNDCTVPVAESSGLTDISGSRNTSVETKSVDRQSPGGCDTVSVTALTLQLSSSSFALSTTDNKLDVSNKREIEDHGQTSSTTYAEKDTTVFQSPLSVQSVMAAFPSFCSVTPPSIDEDEASISITDQADNSSQYEMCSVLSPSATVSTPLPPEVAVSEHSKSEDVSVLNYYTLPKTTTVPVAETNADSKFSTWPCSPVPGSVRGILKSKSYGTKCHQPHKFIKFSPVVSPGQEVSYNCTPLAINSKSYRETEASSPALSESLILEQNKEHHLGDSSSGSTLLNQSDGSISVTPFEGAMSSEDKAGKTSAVETLSASDLLASDAGIPAALVVSSPVILQSTYVENTHRRLICRPVQPDKWHKFTSYASKNHWSSTLPRNLGSVCRTVNKYGTERHHRRVRTEGRNSQNRQQNIIVHGSQLAGGTVSVAQQNNVSVPITLFSSPTRYGIDGYCSEEGLQTKNNPTVECDTPVDYRKEAVKSAVVVKPVSTVLPKNVSEIRAAERETQNVSLSNHSLKPSNDVTQLPSFKGKGPKPAVKLMPEGVYECDIAPLNGKDGIRLPCQSSGCQQDNSLESSVTVWPVAELQTTDNTCTCVNFNGTDVCATVVGDVQVAESDCMQTMDIKCSQSDLLPINSAAVYNVLNARDSIAHSSDSISSTLSAAERSRTAKLAFLGFSISEDDHPVINSADVGHDTCCMFPARSDDTSISCSSSGLGSSVSGSPVVSLDDNTLNTVNHSLAEAEHVSCGGPVSKSDEQLLDCTMTYRRTVLRTDLSKQTAV